MLCSMIFCLASCKEEDHSKEVRETAKLFMEAVETGDFTKASSYCSDEEAKALGWESYSEDATDDFTDSLSGGDSSTSGYSPSDAVISIISSWVDQLCSEMITDYKISDEFPHEKQVYTVPIEISYHDTNNLSEEVKRSAERYMKGDLSKLLTSEKMAELTQIYLSKGQNAMLDELFQTILPDLLDDVSKSYKESPALTDTIQLTIENVEGDWLITGDDGKLRDITSLRNTSAVDYDSSESSTEAAAPDKGASTESVSSDKGSSTEAAADSTAK